MKLELHHINLSTRDVKELESFYKDILFLDTQTKDLPTLEKKKGYSGDVAFVGDGKVQMHLAQKHRPSAGLFLPRPTVMPLLL